MTSEINCNAELQGNKQLIWLKGRIKFLMPNHETIHKYIYLDICMFS